MELDFLWFSCNVFIGFIHGLKSNGSRIGQVTLYTPQETPALGAALLAAKKVGRTIACEQRTVLFEVLTL